MNNAVNRYKEVRATTSTPAELLVALYDGVFRFVNAGKLCFEHKQPARAREQIAKARNIVSELLIALDHDAAPELCANLASLYDFCLDRLMLANRHGTSDPLDDVLRVLTPLREAWKTAALDVAKQPMARTG